MGLIKEFKEFAMRGNLVDLAIAFVMGGAFGKIVSAFVDGMVMPAVGMLTGGVDFSDKKLVLQAAYGDSMPEVAIQYGQFITSCIDLLVVSFAVFIIVKAINRMKREEPAAPPAAPAMSKEEKLLTEIRDLLKQGK